MLQKYVMYQVSSQHKKTKPCLSKTRGSAGSITKSTALIGISVTESSRLKELPKEKKRSEKSGEDLKQVSPAFFVGCSTKL